MNNYYGFQFHIQLINYFQKQNYLNKFNLQLVNLLNRFCVNIINLDVSVNLLYLTNNNKNVSKSPEERSVALAYLSLNIKVMLS